MVFLPFSTIFSLIHACNVSTQNQNQSRRLPELTNDVAFLGVAKQPANRTALNFAA